MILETKRLILRRYNADDFNDLYEYLSDNEVVKFEQYKAMTAEETKDNLKWRIETDEMIAVELKENHKMIGNVYLGKRDFNSLEIGYVLTENIGETDMLRKVAKRWFNTRSVTVLTENSQNVIPIMKTHGDYWKQ